MQKLARPALTYNKFKAHNSKASMLQGSNEALFLTQIIPAKPAGVAPWRHEDP